MPPRRPRSAAAAPAVLRSEIFQHCTRSGRAWSYRVRRADHPAAMAPRPPPASPTTAPNAADPLHDVRGVKKEEEGGGGGEEAGVCVFVKDLRMRRVFTPSSLAVDCSPDRNAKAGGGHKATCSPDRIDAVGSVGMGEGVAQAESSPEVVKDVEGVVEKAGVLMRGGGSGDEGMFQTPGGVQSTPPDPYVISKSETAVDGSDAASQYSGGCADGRFPQKQKNRSDQSHSRPGIAPCSRVKLVRDPKSFSYRRLLPFLMNLTRTSPNTLEAIPWQRHTIKFEKPMVEKSIQPLSSSPAQVKMDLPEAMHRDLDPMGHMKEIVAVLEQPGNDTHELFSGNSGDNVHDTVAKSSSSYIECAKLSLQFNAHELEMIRKQSSNLPATTNALSVEELIGGTEDPSDSPRQMKANSRMIVNGLSTQTSQFGAACPMREKYSPSTKGILKRPRGCIGLCTCLDCTSFRLHAERAFEFSRKQMQDAEDVAMCLINELSCLRKLVENHHTISMCATRSDIHQHGQVKGVCRRASRAEDLARKRLREMNDDINAHCRNILPRVTFSESTEERVISETETSDAE